MNKYRIRFNKTRGMPGRGTAKHVWRVFVDEHEYLFKHLDIDVPVKSEKEDASDDYNIVCFGYLNIDRETSTAVIKKTPTPPSNIAVFEENLRILSVVKG